MGACYSIKKESIFSSKIAPDIFLNKIKLDMIPKKIYLHPDGSTYIIRRNGMGSKIFDINNNINNNNTDELIITEE